jgi:S1-C subfamily serine protease
MKDKKEKTENKEKSKFIKVKDPKKAGIMSFIIMLVVSALLIGSIVTIILFDYLYAPNVETDQQKIEDDKIEVVITEEESSVINVVKSVEKSVVSIAVNQLFFSTEQGIIDESNNIGTGFVVDKNGLIVTNQHVVSDIDADYVVVTSEGKEYEVADIERDDSNDIAILKVEATDLVPIPLGNSDAVVVGQTVIAIGTPLGKYMGSVTTGIISGLDRDVTASTGWFGSSAKTYEDVIQTDAAINPGNSGGPLLNTSGEVIGINFATTSGADNISFALPINVVKKRIEEYRTYGKFIKPYLGVSYQMISEYQAVYYENIVAGALIVRVDPYGPAQKAGIERGDIIIEFAGKKVDESLANIISQHEVGEEVELKVWNNEKERTIKVTLGEQE